MKIEFKVIPPGPLHQQKSNLPKGKRNRSGGKTKVSAKLDAVKAQKHLAEMLKRAAKRAAHDNYKELDH